MAKVSESVHHEGVCMLVRRALGPLRGPIFSPGSNQTAADLPSLSRRSAKSHNIGSILPARPLRIPFVLGEEGKLPALSPSACRIAKGGAETVAGGAVRTGPAIDWLKKWFFDSLDILA